MKEVFLVGTPKGVRRNSWEAVCVSHTEATTVAKELGCSIIKGVSPRSGRRK